jgi:pimeloyl-ACP methyl ester carboxylesterase
MGDSTHRPSYRHADWSGELVRIAESLGADVRIVGHSFGGARALEACVLRPDSFTRLVVVDSYLHLAAPRPTRQGSWSIHTAARNYPDFATALARYRLVPPEEPPRYMFQHAARHAALRHATGWGWKFDPRLLSEQRMHEDARPLLHDLRVPMTVVHGTRSGVMPPSLVEDVLRLCPMSQRALAIADAGHHLPLTHPLELLGALREVLDHRWGAPVTQPRQVAAIKPLSGDMRP